MRPTQELVREDVARLAEATSGWDSAITAYREAIESSADLDVQTNLRLQLGGLLRQVEKVSEAIEQYNAVYESETDNLEAITALEELYRSTEQFEPLLGVYERRMDLEDDPESRRALAYARAGLWENELTDPPAAIVWA